MVDPGGVGEPPPGGLEVESQLADETERATGHVGDRSPRGNLREVRQVGQLVEHQAHGLGEVLTGHRPDASRVCAHAEVSAAARRVAEIVAEPTTRDPSYTTTA